MRLKGLLYILVFLFCCQATGMAQAGLTVTLNRSFFKANDTIRLQAKQTGNIKKTATLFLKAQHQDGMLWEMRWPMLNGATEAALVIPDSLPQGQYRLRFSVLQNLFSVFGKVRSPKDVSLLNSTLLTMAGDLYETDVEVMKDGNFTYKNVLFTNDATLIFSLPGRSNNDNLDIQISTVLDSSVFPRKDQVLDIFIGATEPSAPVKPFPAVTDSLVDAEVLETVTVHSKPVSLGSIFDKNYSTGLFKSMNERIISVLDEPYLNSGFTALDVVRMRVAGISISGGLRPLVSWRGDAVSFFIDEMRMSAADVSMIPMSDIAIIKVYPPPFFGNVGGSGGAIAVYTRRGALSADNFRNAFKVKGYTPLFSLFPVLPDK